jgi:nitroreductase
MSFLKNLNWRYATKKFDRTKTVSDEHLHQILEAARMAPTSYGLQPFHITVIKNPELRAKLRTAAWDQSQITDATALLVFSARKDGVNRVQQYLDIASGGNPEVRKAMEGYGQMMTNSMQGLETGGDSDVFAWASKQTYIALGFALAACAELEIDACPMEGFDPAAFKEILNFGENLLPAALLAVGYRDVSDQIRPKVRFPESDLIDNR